MLFYMINEYINFTYQKTAANVTIGYMQMLSLD